jgi:hypothetical protein
MSDILYNGISVSEAILPEYEVGKNHEIRMELYNDYDVKVHYEIESLNPEINIIKYPEMLEAKRKEELIISFSPDIKLRESFLSSIRIKEIFR